MGYESAPEGVEKEYIELDVNIVPSIMNPAIRDVFPLMASMLDIKSFMKLAMASKAMYRKCMNDKRIHMKIKEDVVFVDSETQEMKLSSSIVSNKHTDKYLAALRHMWCDIRLRKFVAEKVMVDQRILDAARDFLKEIGVKSISNMAIRLSPSTDISSFIEDFHVKEFISSGDASDSVLRSLLSTDLDVLAFLGPYSIDVLLDAEFRVSSVLLGRMSQINIHQLMQILRRIHYSTVRSLTICSSQIDWNSFPLLPFEHDGPLPDDRPLIFTQEQLLPSYWVLHSDGHVSLCVASTNHMSPNAIHITKCNPRGLPPSLVAEEEVFKQLRQKRLDVVCSKTHFHCFFQSHVTVDPSHKGPLPDERPLAFSVAENAYMLLNEDGSVEHYEWAMSHAKRKFFDSKHTWPDRCDHPVLAKYILRTLIEKKMNGCFRCNNAEKPELLFEDFTVLPFDYDDVLPEERPIVFAKENIHTVILEDGVVVSCRYKNSCFSLTVCDPTGPFPLPIVLKAKHYLQSLLQRKTTSDTWRISWIGKMEEVASCFEGYRTIPSCELGRTPQELPVVIVNRSSKINFYYFARKDGMIVSCLPRDKFIDLLAFRIPPSMSHYFLSP